jgi:hypothetical protein
MRTIYIERRLNMEKYMKPVMDIVELEKIDVLTCSGCASTLAHNSSATGENTNGYPDGCYTGCTKHSQP